MAESQEEFAARIGIDWSDKKHDVCLQASGSSRLERAVVKHTPECLDEWAQRLRERFGGRPVAVCVELAKGPIVSALEKYDFIVVFPVNPAALANYRKTWSPSGAKDDVTDAELVLDVLVRHPDRLKRLEPQSAEMRALQQLVEQRRKLVNDRVRITNRLTYALKAYFPQALEWFERAIAVNPNMARRLATPRITPIMVRMLRNLCARISLNCSSSLRLRDAAKWLLRYTLAGSARSALRDCSIA